MREAPGAARALPDRRALAVRLVARLGPGLGVGLILWAGLLPAPARAEPVDLADPTPRAIQVEFEVSDDPAVVGQTWSAPFEATYSAAGNVGTVVIPAPVYTAAIRTHDLDYYDLLFAWSLVLGSASSFRLDIDLTTLEATAQTAGYQIAIDNPSIPPQNGTLTRDLATTTTAGYTLHPSFGDFPLFCDSDEIVPCLFVPGAPYDPATGELNAVGLDFLDAPDIQVNGFSRAGDLRLSEMPAVPALPVYGAWGVAALLMTLAAAAGRRAATRRR